MGRAQGQHRAASAAELTTDFDAVFGARRPARPHRPGVEPPTDRTLKAELAHLAAHGVTQDSLFQIAACQNLEAGPGRELAYAVCEHAATSAFEEHRGSLEQMAALAGLSDVECERMGEAIASAAEAMLARMGADDIPKSVAALSDEAWHRVCDDLIYNRFAPGMVRRGRELQVQLAAVHPASLALRHTKSAPERLQRKSTRNPGSAMSGWEYACALTFYGQDGAPQSFARAQGRPLIQTFAKSVEHVLSVGVWAFA